VQVPVAAPPRGVEESSRSGPALPRADRSDTLPRDNCRNATTCGFPTLVPAAGVSYFQGCGTRCEPRELLLWPV